MDKHSDIIRKNGSARETDDPFPSRNECQDGRDAHAPLAFSSHTLSFHVRISEIIGSSSWAGEVPIVA
jgi:hypothetical protein